MGDWSSSYSVDLTAHLTVELPLIRDPSTGFAFYSFNMMGKADWCEKTAHELLNRLNLKLDAAPEVFVTAEAKAIALTQELARNFRHERYVVLRKSRKSYMETPVSFRGGSITSGEQEYWVEQTDLDYLHDKRVVLVDDVVSTGGTAKTFLKVIELVRCKLEAFCCVLTEGTPWTEFEGIPVISLNHIPLPGVIQDESGSVLV
jgi:adenine phosphoribosyltransferase